MTTRSYFSIEWLKNRGSSYYLRFFCALFKRYTVALRAELLVSEIVSDAVDHGSDAATLRISLDDDKLELELFDGPRRSAIATNGRAEGVPAMRNRVLAKVADGRYSSDLGESHYARYEIRPT